MTRSPYTPDLAGYVLAVLVSWAVFTAPLLALAILVGPYVVFVPVVVVAAGTPIALVGTVTTHVLCRCVARQGIHVLVIGVLGFALTCVFFRFWETGMTLPLFALALWVGVCAAVGRASVVRRVPATGVTIGPAGVAPVTLSRRALPMRADER